MIVIGVKLVNYHYLCFKIMNFGYIVQFLIE